MRNVEDWRADKQGNGKSWAIHCLWHDHRTFYESYRQALLAVDVPSACPTCQSFDSRCLHCPSDWDMWVVDPNAGYTPSTGHRRGQAVCEHHKYGVIPQGIDYLEVRDVVKNKPVIEVFVGAAFTGLKVLSLEFQTGDQVFWAKRASLPDFITQQTLLELQTAFEFAGRVLDHLNFPPNAAAPVYETWEEREKRLRKVQ